MKVTISVPHIHTISLKGHASHLLDLINIKAHKKEKRLEAERLHETIRKILLERQKARNLYSFNAHAHKYANERAFCEESTAQSKKAIIHRSNSIAGCESAAFETKPYFGPVAFTVFVTSDDDGSIEAIEYVPASSEARSC